MKRRAITIIISSAGRRVGLIECFRRAAGELELDLRVVACDMAPELSAACHVADVCFQTPHTGDPSFATVMRDIAVREKADLLVPTIDPELLPLAVAAREFAACGCRVHVSSPDVIDVVRNKLETMRVLGAAGIPVPHTYDFESVCSDPGLGAWPMFMKPTSGSASRSISIIRTRNDLPSSVDEPMILQHFLDGPEFTVNAFVDLEGNLRSTVTHRRIRIRSGEVEKGVTERHPLHARIALDITRALPALRGAFCFQIIEDLKLGPCVIEINARFGGGYPLVDRAGAGYAKWLLEEISGVESSASDQWREGVLMLRYDAAVYTG